MFAIEDKGKVVADAVRRALLCLALCVICCAPNLALAQKGPAPKPKDKSTLGDTKPTLVSYDPEYAQLLDEARRLLDNPDDPDSEDFGFEILQTMINRGESFCPLDENSSLFVGLRVKANEILADLPPEGLKKYRVLYDAAAKGIFEQARGGDFGKLHQVVDQYRFTSYGTRAMDLLGSVYFDRARFSQAAAVWQLLLASHPSEEEIPPVLAKAATAYHLAGMPAMADKMAKALKDRYPMATAEFSGARQNLQEFVRLARLIQPETLGTLPDFLRPKHIFPGLGGVPDGASVMSDCDTLLVSRWLLAANEQTGIKTPNNLNISSDLMALREALDNSQTNNGQGVNCRLERGQVQVRFGAQMGILPPAILPVVVDDMVIYRTSEGIVACNIITGEVVWRKGTKAAPFPMQRAININRNMWGGFPTVIEDLGRYAMTLGGGNLYAVGNYRGWIHPNMLNNPGIIAPEDKKKLFDGSTLVALSVKSEGKLRWQVGNGQGDDDIVRFGKILCAPTYCSGKLYVVSSYTESYHLLCLDADTGKLLWKNTISQGQSGNPMMGIFAPAERSGPPAVADGRVFVLTNSAVVAAFDADSGQPLWAFQYDQPSGGTPNRFFGRQPASVEDRAVNPILAINGRVIFLPQDSNTVFCLFAEDGKPAWTETVTRREQRDLSYIDENRFLLSGPGMYVMNVADGKEIYGRSNGGIYGRPVVSSQAVLCSGMGQLCRLDLQKYVTSTIDLISADALLGNLVCVDGVLVASNAAGICAYFNYDQAFKKMTERIAQAATPEDKLDWTFKRAEMSFSAKRIPSALQDFLDCQKMAKEQNNGDMVEQLAPRLCRAYIAMANHGTDPQQMVEYVRKAGEYARSDQEKALYMLRLAKCLRKAGDLKTALSGAQELSDKMPEELLADVAVGPESDDTVRQDVPAQRTARSVAQDLIGEIVDSGAAGRAAYKEFDDLAKAALDKARAAHDPEAMIALSGTWPHSLYADEAQFTAAEEYYRQSLKAASPEDASVAVGNAMKYLSIAAAGNGKYRAPARLAMAMIYKQCGSLAMAQLSLDQLEGVAPQSDFTFADLHGKVSDLLKQIGASSILPAVPDVSMVKGSLDQLYAIPGQSVMILTDQKGSPVRLGDQVLVLRDDRVVLVDTQARDPESAITWSALSTVHLPPVPADGSGFYGPQFKRVIAGLSKDKKMIGVADYETACGLDVRSARIVWRHAMGEYGGRLEPGMLSIGEGMLVFSDQNGRVNCVDLSTGELAWSSDPASAVRGVVAAPTISGGMVLARCNGGHSLVCWNLKSGKMQAAIEGKTSANGMFTPQGLLVTLVDDELSIREPGNMQRAVWVRKYPGQFSALGAALSDRVLVTSDVRTSSELDVISLVSGAKLDTQTIHLGNIGGNAAVPLLRDCQSPKFRDLHTILCDVQGQNLYVTCTRNTQSGVAINAFNGQATPGISIQKFNLKTSKLEWQSDIDAEGATSYFAPALVVGQTHVMFCPGASLKEGAESSDAKVFLIDGADGKLVNTLDPSKSKSDQPGQTVRLGFRMITPAVMTNGRILMENTDGVTVYGGGN